MGMDLLPHSAGFQARSDSSLILLQLSPYDRMRLTSLQLAIEQPIYRLQRNVLRLGNQEIHKHTRANHQPRKEEIHPVAHSGKHLRRKPCDKEIPEPVVCSSEGLCKTTHVLSKHLRVQHPWGRVPSGTIESGPEVEEEDCGDAGGGKGLGWVKRGFGDCDIAAYVPEAGGAADGADHQETSASKLIDEEDEVDQREYCLDDAKESGGEKRGGCPCYADGFEDGRAVVVDGINPRGVLPEEERAAEEEAPLDLSA